MLAELEKLETNLGGVADMKRLPDAIFVVDLKKEQLAIREARRLGLPIVGLVDTNCDPDDADYVIPGNDDAIRSCSLIVRVIADAVDAGRSGVTEAELARTNGRVEEERGPEAGPEELVVSEDPLSPNLVEPVESQEPVAQEQPQSELAAEVADGEEAAAK